MEDLTQLAYAVDTFYFLVMGALVMFMAPGFAMLEAGMVRAKNTSEILTKNIALFSIACIMYILVGYNLMYGGYVPEFMLGAENSVDDVLASGGDTYYSARSDFFFQVVFVATAMSIISGAVAERIKLWSFLLFAVVMTGFIYPIQGSWSWGHNGFLGDMNFIDFAGSGIVHMCGAAAALAGVILLGPRAGRYNEDGSINAMPGANMPLATLGTFILWFGWFGFNGGSQLALGSAADATAMSIVYVNTNLAAAAGVVSAMVLAQILYKKLDLTFALNGAIAGLVAITAGPDLQNHFLAIVVGAIGGLLVVIAVPLLDKLKIDDVVGAISAHLVAGIWGTLAVGIFGSGSFLTQLWGVVLIGAFVSIASAIVWLALKYTVGIRVSEEEEMDGLDKAELGMEAYPEFGKGSQTL